MTQSQKWEKREDDKYSDIYRNNYPSSNPLKVVCWAKLKNKARVIDLGCGRAVLARYFSDYTGTDISSFIIKENNRTIPGVKFYHIGLHSLQDIQSSFDYVVCLDVLEHIPEKHIDSAMASISKVDAEIFVFSISVRKSRILSKKGENLHLTVWRKEMWEKIILERFRIIDSIFLEDRESIWFKLGKLRIKVFL